MSLTNAYRRMKSFWHKLRYEVSLVEMWALLIALICLVGLMASLTLTSGELPSAPVQILDAIAISICAMYMSGTIIISAFRFQDAVEGWLKRHTGILNALTATMGIIALPLLGYMLWHDRHTPHGQLYLRFIGVMLIGTGVWLLLMILLTIISMVRINRQNRQTPS